MTAFHNQSQSIDSQSFLKCMYPYNANFSGLFYLKIKYAKLTLFLIAVKVICSFGESSSHDIRSDGKIIKNLEHFSTCWKF